MATKKTTDTEEKKKPATAEKSSAKKAPVKEKAPKKAKEEEEVLETTVEHFEEAEAEEVKASKAAKGGSFIPTVGRRKRSIARVRLIKNGKGTITVNGKKYDEYFTTYDLRDSVMSPLRVTGQDTAIDISALVQGGGIRGQAEAVRHGISRALVELNPTFRKTLKKLGFLMRDPRQRERKKFGLRGARRSPQWSKR